jgi:PAS domain S-box-containing protein
MLTGFSAEQIISAPSWINLLIIQHDQQVFSEYISQVLTLVIINKTLEFRILSRSKQIRWCEIKSGAVYDNKGKYLGIRASIRDITRLKEALTHIKDLNDQKTLKERAIGKLKSDMEVRDRELVNSLVLLSKKNELLNHLKRKLELCLGCNPADMKKQLAEMAGKIEQEGKNKMDLSYFETQLQNSHPGFFERLTTMHPRLSPNEKNLCAFLRLSLSSKEIAYLTGISPKSVEIARVRLRKKLKLSSSARLTNYIASI